MRIPLVVLAATLCLNGAVVAAPTPAAKPELPKWQPVEEGWGAWVAVEFTDAAGKYHSLRCHWSECGRSAKPGTANLYEWKQNGEQIAFEYKDPRTGQKNQAWKTTFTTKLSYYKLKVDKGQWTALDPATGKTFDVHSTPDMTALGSVVIVAAPTAMASDAPAAPGKTPGKTPGQQPAKKPAQPAKKPAQPGRKPTTTPVGKLVPLTDREKAWLSDTDRAIYDAGMTKDPTAKDADKKQIAAQYREVLAKTGLPAEAREGYKPLTAAPDAAKIDAYLVTVVELSPAEQAALEKIVKGKEPAGFKLAKDNARLDYADEMAKLKKDAAGHPAAEETHPAYTVASKYRAMLKASGAAVTPNPDPNSPGGAPTAGSARLSDKELAALTPEQRKAYQDAIAAAGNDAGKIADINKQYRSIAARQNIDVFTSLNPDEKKDLCAPYKNYVAGNGGAAGSAPVACDPTTIDTSKCKKPKGGLDQKCVADLTKACQTAQAAPPQTPASAPALPPLNKDVQAACAALNQSLTPPVNTGSGNYSADVPSPGSKAGTDTNPNPEKKGFFDSMSKETASNIKAGVAGAFVGILFGSFFGPVGMIVGAAIGGGLFFGGNYVANKLP